MTRSRLPTAARLREAGLQLFAERGFDAVTVGQIEEQVGLVPRRGAMYRHFSSKDALLESAVEHHLESVAAARQQYTDTRGVSVLAARDLGRWILDELDRQRAITRVLERDGERLPVLRERFRVEVSEAGYAAMTEVLSGWLKHQQPVPGTDHCDVGDVAPQAVLLLGALVNLRRSAWTFGAGPAGVGDDEVLEAWAHLCAAIVHKKEVP